MKPWRLSGLPWATVRRAAFVAMVGSGLVAGCQAVAPALTALGIAFGQDLLAATSVNQSPRYAVHLEELLVILARQATGLDFQPQLAQSGYRPPPPEYAQQTNPYGYPGQGAYGYPAQQPGYGYPTQQTGSGYPSQQTGYGYPSEQTGSSYPSQQGGYSYPSQQGGYSYPTEQSGYGYPGQGSPGTYTGTQSTGTPGYGTGYGYPTTAQNTGYPDPYGAYRSASGAVQGTRSIDDGAAEPIALGIALLAQRAGSDILEQIEDGAVLRDGRGDPARGDRLKIHFQANCACYVYVIGIDATGRVAEIFPDAEDGRTNPVTPGENYVLPGGSQWWALDDQRGIEQIFFVAAAEPRPQIEDALRRLAEAAPQQTRERIRPVVEPAIPPPTRGLVKIDAANPIAMPVAGVTANTVRPAVFTGAEPGVDVVVTRWFRHE